MKKAGILHPVIAQVVASLGHGDLVVVADAGLPIPPGPERVDLAYAPGRPPLLDVLRSLLEEMEVERALLAEEVRSFTQDEFYRALHQELLRLPKVAARGVEYQPHDNLKALLKVARVVIRTGEFTPYANVVLVAGVVF
ncbi:D-ribose pyranase [Thermus sp. SYSU G05001]|uniref:D-ribose pyranase n=1 Tax=Thermus brevis TaxID=2862456 RepID=A0ABS6ZX77_9DEIN|nr:D-ribose pyranase [Thermus brevis]MBW6394656.1 D-ribose pyranase [Thermus brevis]